MNFIASLVIILSVIILGACTGSNDQGTSSGAAGGGAVGKNGMKNSSETIGDAPNPPVNNPAEATTGKNESAAPGHEPDKKNSH